MRSSSPGSWEDLLWRLRAETAAAARGDLAAVAALAAGATPPSSPPERRTLALAAHLQLRLIRLLSARAQAVGDHVLYLQAARLAEAPDPASPRRLNVGS